MLQTVNDLPSLRKRVSAGTILLLLLVSAMTLTGVSAMHFLDNAVQVELATLRERTALAQAITRDVVAAVRLGDRVELGRDSLRAPLETAFATLRTSTGAYAEVPALSPQEQAALARVRRLEEELQRRSGSDVTESRAPIADSLLNEVGALVAVQEGAAAERAAQLAPEAADIQANLDAVRKAFQ